MRATSAGPAVLDVTDERGALYDRVTLATHVVDRIEVVVRDREDEPAYLDAEVATEGGERHFAAGLLYPSDAAAHLWWAERWCL